MVSQVHSCGANSRNHKIGPKRHKPGLQPSLSQPPSASHTDQQADLAVAVLVDHRELAARSGEIEAPNRGPLVNQLDRKRVVDENLPRGEERGRREKYRGWKERGRPQRSLAPTPLPTTDESRAVATVRALKIWPSLRPTRSTSRPTGPPITLMYLNGKQHTGEHQRENRQPAGRDGRNQTPRVPLI